MNFKEELEFALSLAAKCSQEILQKPLLIDEKLNPQDLVTEIDKRVEEICFQSVSKHFPQDGFLGEEGNQKASKSSKTWVIDPVDGTTNFVHGFEFYCISIGMMVDEYPVLGVVYNPMLGKLYYAVEGQGAFVLKGRVEDILNAKPIKLGQSSLLPKQLAYALIGTEFGSSKDLKILNDKVEVMHKVMGGNHNGRGMRMVGSAAMNLCLVAEGVLDIYYEAGVHAWDVCAGVVIVKESGGKLSSWNGQKFDVRDRTVVAQRGGSGETKVFEELLDILKDYKLDYERD